MEMGGEGGRKRRRGVPEGGRWCLLIVIVVVIGSLCKERLGNVKCTRLIGDIYLFVFVSITELVQFVCVLP
jgi:hypothetical protein